MHIEGKPLDKVAVGGFRSTARRTKAAWSLLEEQGERVAVVSVPGSTPPEIQNGVVVRGRWGNWGPDYAAVNFESEGDASQRKKQGVASKLFFFGANLTQYVKDAPLDGWSADLGDCYQPRGVEMEAWGATLHGVLCRSNKDDSSQYNRLLVSSDKSSIEASVGLGEISPWNPISLVFAADGATKASVPSHYKAELIKTGDNGFFRIRIIYDVLNSFVTAPPLVAETLERKAGPMVDFADNFPPQLIHYKEDKVAYLKEQEESFRWHTSVVNPIVGSFKPSVVIHDVYNPNQMLTSRWWLSKVDPASRRYKDWSPAERAEAWTELLAMYQHIDAVLGEVMKIADENTFIVLSSDHGNIPLDRSVRINNALAKKGLLKFAVNPSTGVSEIDWANSRAVFLQMCHIYINPKGLAGPYVRQKGPEYEKLREEVMEVVRSLHDTDGTRPLDRMATWEDAPKVFKLPSDRVGDLVIANKPGYGWSEEMTADGELFVTPLIAGYKQALVPEHSEGLLTPFLVSGPGIKRNFYLGSKPISHIDQLPTIMRMVGVQTPAGVDGRVEERVFTRKP
jgi:predicted AlkP superfamily phosphohydrolase/phosphomutase